MPSFNTIAADKLLRLVGTPACPAVVDVRPDPSDLLPASIPRGADKVAQWAMEFAERPVVVACGDGRDLSPEGAAWSDRDGLCTFDALVRDFGLSGFPALPRLAEIVRGADTGRPELSPQSAGLLALSLGLSRMHSDDLEQLADGMLLYDALYRWCRDAADETHDPPAHVAKRGR